MKGKKNKWREVFNVRRGQCEGEGRNNKSMSEKSIGKYHIVYSKIHMYVCMYLSIYIYVVTYATSSDNASPKSDIDHLRKNSCVSYSKPPFKLLMRGVLKTLKITQCNAIGLGYLSEIEVL